MGLPKQAEKSKNLAKSKGFIPQCPPILSPNRGFSEVKRKIETRKSHKK